MADAQTQFQCMTENIPGMIFRYIRRVDGSHFIDYVSSKCRDLHEVEPEAALSDPDKLFFRWHPEDANRQWSSFENSVKNLTPFREEYKVVLPTTGLGWHQIFAQPTRYNNGDTI